MGVVKLVMPKYMNDSFLAHNPMWKRYTAMGIFQILTLTQVIWLGVGKWQ
jgi:hypothetical protein